MARTVAEYLAEISATAGGQRIWTVTGHSFNAISLWISETGRKRRTTGFSRVCADKVSRPAWSIAITFRRRLYGALIRAKRWAT